MPIRIFVQGILLDLLTGLVAASLFFFLAAYSFGAGGMRTVFAGSGLIFALCGLLRGSSPPAYSGLKALVLISVFVVTFTFIRPIPRFKL